MHADPNPPEYYMLTMGAIHHGSGTALLCQLTPVIPFPASYYA
jgi:hypothetical protein